MVARINRLIDAYPNLECLHKVLPACIAITGITAEFEHKNIVLWTCNRAVLFVTVQEQKSVQCKLEVWFCSVNF